MTRRLSLPDTPALKGAEVRRSAPSAERNAAPILTELQRLLPPNAHVLELASGTGQHAAHFAKALPELNWQPTDAVAETFPSIQAWNEDVANVRPPLLINAGQPGWATQHEGYDAAFVVNLLHLISGNEAQNVVHGMAQAVKPGGLVIIYGPFRRNEALTSEGDRQFDASLKAQDPAIGYKDIKQLQRWSLDIGLELEDCIEMPANNLLFVFRTPT